jgi:hypothetical protein
MSPKDPDTSSRDDMADEIAALRREIAMLNSHRLVRIWDKPFQLLVFRFLSGLASGLGTVIGATLLVSLLVYWLQGINWIPVVGDWASQIADRIETERAEETRNGTPLYSEPSAEPPAGTDNGEAVPGQSGAEPPATGTDAPDDAGQ